MCEKTAIETSCAKEKATELELTWRVINGKPYYSIKYKLFGENYYHIGYSSYSFKNVLKWKDEYFEMVTEENAEDAAPEFVMSLGSFKTIWKCPKCGKRFKLKHEKEGIIQKSDIDVNYCSKCGTKFNWGDGD